MATSSPTTPKLARLLREPTVHFFAVAALVLFSQRLVEGDPRTIEITPALKADLLRRYQDQLDRAPTAAEAEAFMAAWKADEALYREAVREGIDRDDATVRNVLIAKMRERILLETRLAEPTEAELERYLEQHRGEFEAPLLYEHDYVVFPKQQPGAGEERARVAARFSAGATPASLGLRSTAANVDRARMDQEFGAELAEKIRKLSPGQWHELETADRLLLVRLNRVHGGLPPPEELRARLVAGWKGEAQKQAIERATQGIAERYQFEEPAR